MSVLTEDQIERRVERFVDHLDAVFLAGRINHATYDSAIRDLHKWADGKYREAEAARVRPLLGRV